MNLTSTERAPTNRRQCKTGRSENTMLRPAPSHTSYTMMMILSYTALSIINILIFFYIGSNQVVLAICHNGKNYFVKIAQERG